MPIRYVEPDIKLLHNLLYYDYKTGFLVWHGLKHRVQHNGTRAGTLNADGYRQIPIAGRLTQASRIAWAMHYGKYPKGEIDHRDRNRDNNAILNLREASRSQNMGNMLRPPRFYKGMQLPKGVHVTANGRFKVQGSKNYIKTYLGTFDSVDEARDAYETWAKINYGDFRV